MPSTASSSSSSRPPKPKIVVTDSSVWVPKLFEIGDVYQNREQGQMKRDNLLEQIVDAEALFCLVRDKIDKELLHKAKKLKIVATMSVGYEHIDVAECKKKGITIGYTPGVLTEATAELAISLLLATARRLPEAIAAAKNGDWSTWAPYWMCGKSLSDSTIGIYGMGTIGRSIVDKLLPFGPKRILYTNRSPSNEARGVCKYVPFDELLRESDFLIISARSTSENYRIFDKKSFSKMKNDAILVNVARGTLVNQEDLYAALSNGQLAAAGLDVTDPEPLPTVNPLFKLPNCVILPHIGSATYSTRNAMASTTEDNIYNCMTGKPLAAELKV